MNKVVRENYPASKLPSELRGGIDPASKVTVTVVAEERPAHRVLSIEEIIAARRPPFFSAEEIDADLTEGRKDRDG